MSNYIRNGRGSAHSGVKFSTWQRHSPQCEARGFVTKKSGAPCEKCRGSRATQELRFFALMVAVFITRQSLRLSDGTPVKLADLATMDADTLAGITFVCPVTGDRIPVATADTDRVLPGALGGRYVPGNVVLISPDANNIKGEAAPDGDWVATVEAATARVERVHGVPRGKSMPSGYRVAVSTAATAV